MLVFIGDIAAFVSVCRLDISILTWNRQTFLMQQFSQNLLYVLANARDLLRQFLLHFHVGLTSDHNALCLRRACAVHGLGR